MPKGIQNVPTEPTQDYAKKSDIQELKSMMDILTEKFAEKPMQSRYTKHEKEHVAFLREYIEEDDKHWIAIKIYNVREKRDPDQAKRYIGMCKIDLFNPETSEQKTIDADYLRFLQETPQVLAKIVNTTKTERIEQKVGPRYNQKENNEVLSEQNFMHEVLFVDVAYEVLVLQGTFKDKIFKCDGKALNM
jgi:hypothetical protein